MSINTGKLHRPHMINILYWQYIQLLSGNQRQIARLSPRIANNSTHTINIYCQYWNILVFIKPSNQYFQYWQIINIFQQMFNNIDKYWSSEGPLKHCNCNRIVNFAKLKQEKLKRLKFGSLEVINLGSKILQQCN